MGEGDGVRRAVVDHDSAAQELRKADESQSMPDALGPGHGAGAPLRRRQRRRQLSRNLHLLWRGMRRSRAHAVAVTVAVAFAARCRRVLRGVGKEEEEGQLRTGVGAGVGAGLISLLNIKRTPVIYPKTLSEVNFSTICVDDGVLLELVVPVIHPSPG